MKARLRINEHLLFYSLLYNFMCVGSENCSTKLNVKPQLDVAPRLIFKFVLGRSEGTQAAIECGNRNIQINRASGEALPFITLTEKKEEGGELLEGFCIHSETVFNTLWDKLKEMPTRIADTKKT